MITDKTQIAFEEFLRSNKEIQRLNEETKILDLYGFDGLPLSMQIGVYQLFFDSVEVWISIRHIANSYWYVIKYMNSKRIKDRYEGNFNTREQAWIKAIEQADKIYNENK